MSKTKRSAKDLARPLREAARTGNLKRLRELLDEGAEPDRRAPGQCTALIAAASAGHLEIVKELLRSGADPSFAHGGTRGTTALLEAIRHRRFAVARALITAGADVHHDWSGEGQTITYEATKLCNKMRREQGAKTDFADCLNVVRDLLAAGGEVKPGVLHQAATAGNLELIRLLLDTGTDVNQVVGSLGFTDTALSTAVFNGHEEAAVELLHRGADPWLDKPMMGGPVLHEAVVKGLAGVVRTMVETKADLNGRGDITVGERPPTTVEKDKDAKGRVVSREYVVHDAPTARQATALIAAVRCGRKDMVDFLVKGGADLETTDSDGFTPLDWALKLGRDDLATILRRAGAKESAQPRGSPQFALVTAAGEGDVAGVREALANGADPSALHDLEKDRVTALMRAAEAGHLAVVKELLAAGANPNQIGIRNMLIGVTPLILAARNGHAEVVKRLLAMGADPGVRQASLGALMESGRARQRWRAAGDDLAAQHAGLLQDPRYRGDSAIHEAAAAGHDDVVKLLLKAGATPTARSAASGTVFEAAAESGDRRTVETLLSAKGGRRGKVTVSAAALINAAGSGDRETVRTLLATGVDVNKATRGSTALSAAVARSDKKMVKLLLEAGAKPGETKSPMSELMIAAGAGDNDIAQMLITAGADLNEQDRDGMTALHHAAMFGHADTARFLLQAGALASIRNKEGKTPLQCVRKVISSWSGEKQHPLVKLDLKDHHRVADLLQKAERQG